MAETKLPAVQMLRNRLNSDAVKSRFTEILKEKTPSFIGSLLALANSNTSLAECDQISVINSAMIAATLDLPINPNLGFAYIIPYNGQAQFQIGYKGFLQLAMRSGKLKSINVADVHEGELVKCDPFKGIYEFDATKRTSNKIIGYFAYVEMLNGFSKGEYWEIEKVRLHGQKHSKSFAKPNGRWQQDFDAMGRKTVLKMLISKWTELSIESQMQTAIIADQSVINDFDNISVTYTDAEDLTAQENQAQELKADPSTLFDKGNETSGK